jgi:hypothetical protein
MELNQIRPLGVSRKGAGLRVLTLDLLPELKWEELGVLWKMESNQRGLEREEAGLDAVGDERARGLGNCH